MLSQPFKLLHLLSLMGSVWRGECGGKAAGGKMSSKSIFHAVYFDLRLPSKNQIKVSLGQGEKWGNAVLGLAGGVKSEG